MSAFNFFSSQTGTLIIQLINGNKFTLAHLHFLRAFRSTMSRVFHEFFYSLAVVDT